MNRRNFIRTAMAAAVLGPPVVKAAPDPFKIAFNIIKTPANHKLVGIYAIKHPVSCILEYSAVFEHPPPRPHETTRIP